MPSPLDGLTHAQREAVTHSGGPVLAVGGPGTGKTRVVTRRFAWLVEQGTPAASILVLSSSPSAAAALRAEIEASIDPPWEELWVATVEDFSARLLEHEPLEAGLDPFFCAVTRADRVAMLRDRIDELALRHHEIRGNPVPLLRGFVTRIDRLKQEMVGAGDYRSYAESLGSAAGRDAERVAAARELELAHVYVRHEAWLAEAGALDSGDLVLHAFRLLHEHPHVRERVAARFAHVLVDELEELSFAEGALLRLLSDEHRNVLAAGDDDQAIGRARGGGAKNLADFERDYADAKVVELSESHRSDIVMHAARAVVEPAGGRAKEIAGSDRGEVQFWRCRSERAQAQAAAAEVERLVAQEEVPPEAVAILVRSTADEGAVVGSALEERGIPFRIVGAAGYFGRPEVRDLLAWLRLLSDPDDSGAVVRALTRPPIELRSVDLARLTQLARRRRLDMVTATQAACEGPQLSPEGRDRVQSFLKLHRAATRAFEEMRPDAFVHRLIERIGLRRQQVFATQAATAERLTNIARLGDLARAFMRREPDGTSRDFARYAAALAEVGLDEEPEPRGRTPRAVRIVAMRSAKGLEVEWAFVLGLSAGRFPGPPPPSVERVPDALLKEELPDAGDERHAHEAAARRLVHVATSRARTGLVMSWAESGERGRPAALYEDARAAVGGEEEVFEEELFGPAEGLHSTFRMMRDELLDTVSRVGGRLGEMRLDTYLDVDQAVVRYLELVKLAGLIERARQGQPVEQALPELNELLLQAATPEQRELFAASALDDYLRDAESDRRRRAAALAGPEEASLESFIPRRGEGLMLSASDVETYRLCPLQYKFSRVFRIPQEPTINQRFGIVLHQVLERFHSGGGGSRDDLMGLFEAAWRRCGFGPRTDDLQFRERAVAALERYWELDRERDADPVWLERGFSFQLGPHVIRGRVDRVDRLPDGGYELIDYKTGKPKTPEELREDVQLSLYQMGARESWQLETSAQSYYYVLDNRKVPVAHSDEDLERVRGTVDEVAEGILDQQFEPTPSPDVCPFCDYRIICPAAEE